MRYIPRELEKQVVRALCDFPAVVLIGPRRAGRTCVLRHLFPKAGYFLLEDPDIVARLRAEPHGSLDAVTTPVSLEEVHAGEPGANPDSPTPTHADGDPGGRPRRARLGVAGFCGADLKQAGHLARGGPRMLGRASTRSNES